MKTHQKLISTLLVTALSFPVFAERLIDPASAYDNDYISITGFLGTSINLDFDDGTDINNPDSDVSFAQAIALNWSYKENSEGELIFSNSVRSFNDSDVYLQYLHFGGRILFENTSPFSTSIALGIGGTHIDSDDRSSSYAFSASAAVGMRYQLNQHFAFRSDLRVYGTLLREGHTESFCSGNGCDDGYLIEAELLAGIEYRF